MSASIGSPVNAISNANFRGIDRPTSTIGVVQNQPPAPPGTAKRALDAATARSQAATSWQPAAVANACTRAMTTCGIWWMVVITRAHSSSIRCVASRSASASSPRSWPAENTGPSAASTTPVASESPACRSAIRSASSTSVDRALRRDGRLNATVVVASTRSTRTGSSGMDPR